jgi:predicted RNase H-like HicB family nuclease
MGAGPQTAFRRSQGITQNRGQSSRTSAKSADHINKNAKINLKQLYQAQSTIRDNPMRQVIVHPGEDQYWIAECPSLPGCISQGQTREEALENIKEAIEGYIAALKDDGLNIPEEHFDTIVVAL